jgi:PAS domain-containing protein
LDARDRQETPHTPLGSLWLTIRHWLVAHTFAPPFLTGRWSHPAVGYLFAVVLQVITVTSLVALIRLFPSFQFQEALLILVVLVVSLNWGVGPGLLATLLGAVLLTFLLLPPVFSLMMARIEDGLDLLVYLVVGLAVSLLASQVQQGRHATEGLRRRLDTIIEALPDALSIYDVAGKSVRLNRAAHQLLGHHPPGRQVDVSPTSDGGTDSGEAFPSGDLSSVTRALGGEMVSAVETHLLDEQGNERILITNAAPFYNAEGQIEGAVLISHDISALRRAELEAAAHSRQLEAILEAITDAVVVHDSKGQVILLNAAADRHPCGRRAGSPRRRIRAADELQRITHTQRKRLRDRQRHPRQGRHGASPPGGERTPFARRDGGASSIAAIDPGCLADQCLSRPRG